MSQSPANPPSEPPTVPFWTRPDWSEGQLPEAPKAPIDGYDPFRRNKRRFGSQIRPAQRPDDAARNPSEYAIRFGIYPGRTDGRSRASPTKTTVNQEDFNRAQDVQYASSFLGGDALGENGQQVMRDLDDQYLDEMWQTILFGGLTMNELLEGGHFSMDNNIQYDMGTPISDLLQRDRWKHADSDMNYCQTFINGQREIFDAEQNDRLWNAMAPALQLATKLIELGDEYSVSHRDILKWSYVERELDSRSDDQLVNGPPLFRFRRDPEPTQVLPALRRIRPSQAFNSEAHSRRVLERTLRLCISASSPENLSENNEGGLHVFGFTWAGGKLPYRDNEIYVDPYAPIAIVLTPQMIWPLLSPKFSQAERMMTSLLLAITVAHEFTHAYTAAMRRWIKFPVEFGIVNKQDIQLCQGLYKDLCPHGYDEPSTQPFFEDETQAEEGSAWEDFALGGSIMAGVANQFSGFLWLNGLGVVLTKGSYFEGQIFDSPRNTLQTHVLRHDVYHSFCRVRDVQMLFDSQFWENQVARFGVAAIKGVIQTPGKMTVTREEAMGFRQWWGLAVKDFGEQRAGYVLSNGEVEESDDALLGGFLDDLESDGYDATAQYFWALLYESHQMEFMMHRFVNTAYQLNADEDGISKLWVQVVLLAIEAHHSVACYLREEIHEVEQLITALQDLWRRLTEGISIPGLPDARSRQMAKSTSGHIELAVSTDQVEDRLVAQLLELLVKLARERKLQEGMLAELYNLDEPFFQVYANDLHGHFELFKARNDRFSYLTQKLLEIMEPIRLLFRTWQNDLKQKYMDLAAGFANMQVLLDKRRRPGWEELLETVPNLHKSGVKPSTRWYWLAKREIFRMKGSRRAALAEFQSRFRKLLLLTPDKLVYRRIRGELGTYQKVLQRWYDVVGNLVTSEADWEKSLNLLTEEKISDLLTWLEIRVSEHAEYELKRAQKQKLRPIRLGSRMGFTGPAPSNIHREQSETRFQMVDQVLGHLGHAGANNTVNQQSYVQPHTPTYSVRQLAPADVRLPFARPQGLLFTDNVATDDPGPHQTEPPVISNLRSSLLEASGRNAPDQPSLTEELVASMEQIRVRYHASVQSLMQQRQNSRRALASRKEEMGRSEFPVIPEPTAMDVDQEEQEEEESDKESERASDEDSVLSEDDSKDDIS